jgi:hypothetical protein
MPLENFSSCTVCRRCAAIVEVTLVTDILR